MAAAVADFRPKEPATEKIKKTGGIPKIKLERTADILATIAGELNEADRPKVIVGFAAETDDLTERARHKLHQKGLDLIVANDVSAADAGFQVDTNHRFPSQYF